MTRFVVYTHQVKSLSRARSRRVCVLCSILVSLRQLPLGRLELGVANDARLGLRNQHQQTTSTTARRLGVHDDDGVVPRTTTLVNSGMMVNIKAKRLSVRSKQESSMRTNISAGGSVNYYFGDSCRRNGTNEEDSVVAAKHINSTHASASAGGSSRHVSVGDGKNWQATAGERRIQKAPAHAAAARTQMHSTARAAPDMYSPGPVCVKASGARRAPGRDLHPRRSEYNASDSTESQGSLPVLEANRHWPMPPPQGPQVCQYPYDDGVAPYYYNHHSVEEDPNSCSIM